MGERLSGDGAHDRRHTHHPGTSAFGSHGPLGSLGPVDEDTGRLEAFLAAAIRADGVDAEAEGRAVAAFRAAREAGARRPRTRRRDDWRLRTRPGLARSVKAALSLFAVSLTLGGVAFAAIGSAGSSARDTADDHRRATPSHSVRPQPADRPSDGPSDQASGTGPARPDRPRTAGDTEAHCQAFEQVEGRGKALDATAWQWLIAAAGGVEKVDEYCSALGENSRTKPDKPGNSNETGKPGEAGADAGEQRNDQNEPEKAKGKKE